MSFNFVESQFRRCTMTNNSSPASLNISTYADLQLAMGDTTESKNLTLKTLHDFQFKNTPEEKQMDYLMDSTIFIMEHDLNGWIQKFAPHLLAPPNPLKRSRMSPNRVRERPRETCRECGGETIDDVWQGRVVCTTCGLIHSSSVLVQDVDINVFGIQSAYPMNACVIHEYSRLVYFKSVLLQVQGVTRSTIATCDFLQLQEFCKVYTAGNKDLVTSKLVRSAVHFLHLPKKELRHCHTLAGQIGSSKADLLQIAGDGVLRLCRAFRAIEVLWDEKKKQITKMFKRKSFFNYRFLLSSLVEKIGLSYAGTMPQMKTKKLKDVQCSLFNYVTEGLDFEQFKCCPV